MEMDETMKGFLEGIILGEMQAHKGLAVFPLHHPEKGGPRYLTLQEALAKDHLLITEKSAGGSVPELAVVNHADRPVLLLDGEELVGAKQNRVLNTTVLVAAGAEMVIPVSCTESGRWAYDSDHFEASRHVMPRHVRHDKARAVSRNLETMSSFSSDQGQVWSNIDAMACELGSSSPTSAMREVIDARDADLNAYLDATAPVPGQKGLLVLIGGEVAGMDILSRADAYAILHQKLLRSYAVDALMEERRGRRKEPSFDTAGAFLQEISGCEEKKYESTGLGWDHRFQGPRAVGTALVWRKRVIHAAFFRAMRRDGEGSMDDSGRMRDYRSRRRFREM